MVGRGPTALRRVEYQAELLADPLLAHELPQRTGAQRSLGDPVVGQGLGGDQVFEVACTELGADVDLGWPAGGHARLRVRRAERSSVATSGAGSCAASAATAATASSASRTDQPSPSSPE